MEPDELEVEVDAGDEWGPQMAIPGYIVEPGEDQYRHRVGGDSWKAVDPKSPDVPPMLLLTLDLRDPRLASLQMEGVDELPLAFHMNLEQWPERQVFRIEPETRTVRLVNQSPAEPVPDSEDTWFPNPLPEAWVRLRPMTVADWPLNWNSYCRIRGEFEYGPDSIRVLGPPICIGLREEVTCSCGAPMPYICGIGGVQLRGYIPGGEFYFGSGCFYFFFCQGCHEIATRWQDT
jgi:hypothetical protein